MTPLFGNEELIPSMSLSYGKEFVYQNIIPKLFFEILFKQNK